MPDLKTFATHPFSGRRWRTGLAALGLAAAGINGQAVVINEFLASNSGPFRDGYGRASDWLELFNPSPDQVDLSGYYLTDQISEPAQWRFPERVILDPGGYLVVFASGTGSARDPAGYLHASFSLSRAGESLALIGPDGVTVAHAWEQYPEQERDISYGLSRGEGHYFATPTPGTPNREAFEGQAADTVFSRKRGFYEAPFEVAISTDTEGATIRYTLDGSDPGPFHGTIYTGPIPVTGITTLRAMAYKPGWQATNIDTQTYLFVDQAKEQSPDGSAPGPAWPPPHACPGLCDQAWIDYGMDPEVVNDAACAPLIEEALLSLPSISLVTDLDHLFDPETGLFAVPWGKGRDWERPASIELIHLDRSPGFQIDCGMRLRGSSSANHENPKHAFRFFFRNDYGDPVLRHPLFGSEGADEFEKIDLRTSKNFSWARGAVEGMTMNREVLWRDTQRDMGQPYTRSRYYHLYLNGQYWGIYQTQERSEAAYGATYLGGDQEDYDTIKANARTVHEVGATDGNEAAWTRLWQACSAGFDTDTAYYRVQGLDLDGNPDHLHPPLVDLDNLIDYQLVVFFSGNVDGPLGAWSNDTLVNNYFGLYNRRNPTGWKHFVHDFETSMVPFGGATRLTIDRTGPFGTGEIYPSFSPQWIHERLSVHPEYRMAFADRAHRHFHHDGALTADQVTKRFLKRAAELDPAIIAESARWGDAKREIPSTRNDTWLPSINDLATEYLPRRGNEVLAQLQADGLYPPVAAPSFLVDGAAQHGGYVRPGGLLSMAHSEEGGLLYYTLDGSDPRQPARLGALLSSLVLIGEDRPKEALVPSAPVDDGWRSRIDFDTSGWMTGNSGVGYDNDGDYDADIGLDVRDAMYRENSSCYIRIPFEVPDGDLDSYNELTLGMRYDDGFVVYLNGEEIHRRHFTGTPDHQSRANTFLESREWENFDLPGALARLQPGPNLLAIHGLNQSSGSSDFLINARLEISQTRPAGGGGVAPNAQVYEDALPLGGTTTVKARGLREAEWSALTEAVFTTRAPLENLRLTEVMYHPPEQGTEFIELRNHSSTPLDLGHVRLTGGIFFTFPEITLAAGGHVLVVEDRAGFANAYPGALDQVAGEYHGALSNKGKEITLLDATGTVIQTLVYRDDWYSASDGEGFSLTIRRPFSPGQDASNRGEWKLSTTTGGSPGREDPGLLPDPGSVVINEVLARPETGGGWIELHNPTPTSIPMGGWYLSNETTRLRKFQIAEGTVIPGGGHLLFRAEQHFNQPANPGCLIPFALAAAGGQVCLSSGDGNDLTGYRELQPFGGSLRETSLGRHRKTDGSHDFGALRAATPAAPNATPLVGPVVITEIMHSPAGGVHALEYLELCNIGGEPVSVHEALLALPWRFGAGIDYDFALPPDSLLPPGRCLVLSKSPPAFRAAYGEAD